MNDEYHQIGAAATRLAGRLPHAVMIAVAGLIDQHGGSERSSARQAVLQGIPHLPDFRDARPPDFLDSWLCSCECGVGRRRWPSPCVTAAQAEHDDRGEPDGGIGLDRKPRTRRGGPDSARRNRRSSKS